MVAVKRIFSRPVTILVMLIIVALAVVFLTVFSSHHTLSKPKSVPVRNMSDASNPSDSTEAEITGDNTVNNTTLTAKFLDVGEANSCILKINEGSQNFFAMVDTGGIKGTSGKVVSELQGMGCNELNVLVLTHPDADHVGGATAVMNTFKVDEVWDPGTDGSNSNTWQEVKATIAAKGITRKNPHSGEAYNWLGVQTAVLNPPYGAYYSKTNDWSIVLVETLGSEDIMLTGDAEIAAQLYVVNETFPDVELFEAPHHGANTGYYPPFFDKVHPPNSIISVGPNSYGHPSATVVNALAAFGNVYRADNNGDITVTADANSLKVSTAKNAVNPNPYPAVNPNTSPVPAPTSGTICGVKE
jgi:competence protein ComEC